MRASGIARRTAAITDSDCVVARSTTTTSGAATTPSGSGACAASVTGPISGASSSAATIPSRKKQISEMTSALTAWCLSFTGRRVL